MAAEDRGPEVTAVVGVFLTITWIAILLRCYCRIIIVKLFGLDDWLALISLIFFTVWGIFSLVDVHYGTGKHVLAIGSLERYSLGLKWWWLTEPVYTVSSVTLKWSICVYLLRICVLKIQRIAIYSIAALVGAIGIAYLFISIFQCHPISYFWTAILAKPGNCVTTDFIVDAVYIYSAISCFIDWSLAIIPIFLVYNLQMDRNTKISVAGILALAAVASTATIARMPYIHTLRETSDFLYATTDIAEWSMIETGIGLVASSIATLRPMFKKSLFGSSKTNKTHNQNSRSAWNKYGSRKGAGYIRSTEDNIKLEDTVIGGVNKNGIVTVVESGIVSSERLSPEGSPKSWEDADGAFGLGRMNSETRLNGGEWEGDGGGIRKTMVVSRTAEV